MDTKSVSSSVDCHNCFDRRYIFSSGPVTLTASICPECNGCSPLTTYPENLDPKIIDKWISHDGFHDPKYLARLMNINLATSDLIVKNKDEIEKVYDINRKIFSKRSAVSNLVEKINHAELPSRYTKFFDKPFEDVLDSKTSQIICQWIDASEESNQWLVFYGQNGTGKTLAAVLTALTYIEKYGKSVLFVSVSDIFRIKKLITDTSIMEKSKNHHLQTYENFRRKMEFVDLLILDDLGAQSPSENNSAIYNEIIDMRYKSGNKTIITTNHWKNPDESLDRQTLKTRIGARAADRVCEGEAIAMLGESKRKPLNLVSREEIDNFSTLKCGVNGEVCFSFLARNPFFGIVSKSTRSKYTKENGEDIDFDSRTFNGTWHKDDKLTIYGPLLDVNNDQILYLALLDLLNKNHMNNNSGVWLSTTFSEILDAIRIKFKDKKAMDRIKRSLMRLKRVSIKFKSHDNKTWLGGFIENVVYDGKNKYHEIHISLNPNMIQFYKAHAFFNISLDLMREMNDFTQVLYLFSESHKDGHKLLPLEKFAKLCGRESGPDKEFRKESVKAVKTLINLDLYTDQSRVEKNTIHIYRKPKITQLPQSSPPLQLS